MQNRRPPWLPTEGRIEAVPAGEWWDAIAITGSLGDRVLQHLRETAPDGAGPVLHDAQARGGRTWFFVPVGTAAGWRERGTEALGDGCYIGVPVSLEVPVFGIRWLVRPDEPPALVDPGLLRAALLAARCEVQP